MSLHQFSVDRYFNQDTEQEEWAVFHSTSHVWYFPKIDTEKSAAALADQLNSNAN